MQNSKSKKVLALILKVSKLKDNDNWYLIYSKETGKIRIKARGVLKAKSKFNAILQPGNVVALELFGRSDFFSVVNASLKKCYLLQPIDFDMLVFWSVIVECIQKTIPDDEHNDKLFHFTLYTLSHLYDSSWKNKYSLLVFWLGCFSFNLGIMEMNDHEDLPTFEQLKFITREQIVFWIKRFKNLLEEYSNQKIMTLNNIII